MATVGCGLRLDTRRTATASCSGVTDSATVIRRGPVEPVHREASEIWRARRPLLLQWTRGTPPTDAMRVSEAGGAPARGEG